ncbi:hypothetical protein DPMN_142887, partial [Dreissena polymorpha]
MQQGRRNRSTQYNHSDKSVIGMLLFHIGNWRLTATEATWGKAKNVFAKNYHETGFRISLSTIQMSVMRTQSMSKRGAKRTGAGETS